MTTTFVNHTEQPVYGAMFSIDAIMRANRESGGHYFDADTMRFFHSRVLPTVIAGRLFITSEQSDYGAPRLYSVREFMPDGSIETVGEFQGHRTSAEARAAARTYAKGEHAYYFSNYGKGKNSRTYVVTASDPWEALKRLPRGFRIQHCGHAADYMTAERGYVLR